MAEIEAIYYDIGQNIRRARKEKGLTQKQLGDSVKLSRTSINNIEKARQKLLIHTLFEISDTCGVAPESLLEQHGGIANVPKDLEEWTNKLTQSVNNKSNS